MTTIPDPTPQDTLQATKPSKITRSKGKKLKPRRARHTPSLKDFPDLSDKEKRMFQSYLLTPIAYKERGGRVKFVTIRRKVYAWLRLKGWKHTDALRKAGYTIFTSEAYILHRSKAGKAIKLYWNVGGVNLEYIIDRAVGLIENGTNENSIVRALKLLSDLKGYITSH